ncbi:MAG: hypothetical protein RLZZ29_1689 [Cyanobacteriota bacterium]|jgi:Ca-activated chloride channel family protein
MGINLYGKFYLLLLTDGQTNQGFNFEQVKEIIEYSGVRVYPIAYGEVNEAELNIAPQVKHLKLVFKNCVVR